ncbi:hypothetical protein [Methylobacterium sp. J-090]|uniref:hypothetical protein n=1 Tax=Methylobacterium sp. J-090 TaxID=2836666 RepID=UPI001FB93BE9|nr:hypothetical protein [Methylobacterium sp. J-090]MCJ2080722.1 hypothetical protein [Methylobacterium sp. J-090]
MEQGNRLDSIPAPAVQVVRDDVGEDHALNAAVVALLTAPSAAAPEPDPILAAIAETRRLMLARHAAADLPQPAGSIDTLPEQNAATDAFFVHVDNVLLKTVPTTAAGCAALARYTVEFLETEGFALDEDQANEQLVRILDLIARSPMVLQPLTPTPIHATSVDEMGFVTYEDAAGVVQHRPVAEWIAHTAVRLNRVAKEELNRALDAVCNADPSQDANVVYDRLRKELRVDALHDLAARSNQVFAASKEYAVGHRWQVVGEDADAELLALGREFDVIHAEWVPAVIAQEQAEAKAHALFKDLSERRGWTTMEAHGASWDEPGLREAVDCGEAVAGRMDPVQKAILALPARTLDGLAVKARAIIPSVWPRGRYETDAGLGDEEDWVEQNARSLIDECLHLAGVDWTGRRWQPAASVGEIATDVSALTPKAAAEGVDLSGLGIIELCALYETAGAAREVWGGATCLPLAVAKTSRPHGFVTHTPFGGLADFEDTRLAFLRDRVAAEANSRKPADHWDRDNLLELRIRHELACEGRILDPSLLADIAQTWGAGR